MMQMATKMEILTYILAVWQISKVVEPYMSKKAVRVIFAIYHRNLDYCIKTYNLTIPIEDLLERTNQGGPFGPKMDFVQ